RLDHGYHRAQGNRADLHMTAENGSFHRTRAAEGDVGDVQAVRELEQLHSEVAVGALAGRPVGGLAGIALGFGYERLKARPGRALLDDDGLGGGRVTANHREVLQAV